MKMVDETELSRFGHCAVRLDNCIVMVGGMTFDRRCAKSTDEIWVYNLYTEEWKKEVISNKRQVPDSCLGAVAVAIEGNIYFFGALDYENECAGNALWKLSKTESGCFTWSFMQYECEEESPSPRMRHTGWEYARTLLIFGGQGEGTSLEGYLNNHGEVTEVTKEIGILNNQLLCYDPDTQMWTNPQCFGATPSPRAGPCSAIIRENVWLFGGNIGFKLDTFLDDFFQLNMQSLTWTHIQTCQPNPPVRAGCSLTATTDNQLVLHGGETEEERTLSDTWIMDLTSYSWRPYTSGKDHYRKYHTAAVGLNSNVIIIGGEMGLDNTDVRVKAFKGIFHVLLEPRSLQKLASRMIYKHKAELSVESLPKKLITLFGTYLANEKLLEMFL